MRELMIVGRVFVLVMIAISVVWVPIIDAMEGGQLVSTLLRNDTHDCQEIPEGFSIWGSAHNRPFID